MNKFKNFSLAAFLLLNLQNIYGQSPGYIETDTSANVGITLIKGTSTDNAQYILAIDQDEDTIKYTPKQLKGYGFKNGASYKSRSIPLTGGRQTVFLEVIAEGIITLYYYRDRKGNKFF